MSKDVSKSKSVTTTEEFRWSQEKNEWVPVKKHVETVEQDRLPLGLESPGRWPTPAPHWESGLYPPAGVGG